MLDYRFNVHMQHFKGAKFICQGLLTSLFSGLTIPSMQRGRDDMKVTHWSAALPRTACSDAVAWALTQKSAAIAWRDCKRGDWMLWLIGKVEKSGPYTKERKPIVRVACECARLAWKWMPEKSRDALEVVEAWTRGEATTEQCKEARAAAYAAAYAADAAYAAADAAAYAADAAYAARVATFAKCADIVRKHYPKAPRLT